ncbi:MAG: hypothetical protein NXI01_08965 [Gammaproteobacteria bacterium]|nr:hypothetical protein [Gammaproteobacteria bacterium]
MKISQELYKQLRKEFPSFSSKLITGVVWFVLGDQDNGEFDKKYKAMLRGVNLDTQDERDNFVYDIFLRLARESG